MTTKLKYNYAEVNTPDCSGPYTAVSCNLCLAQFASSQELVDHFDEHFPPGIYANCEHRLILINDDFYYLQLHDATECLQDKQQEFEEDADDGSQDVFEITEILEETPGIVDKKSTRSQRNKTGKWGKGKHEETSQNDERDAVQPIEMIECFDLDEMNNDNSSNFDAEDALETDVSYSKDSIRSKNSKKNNSRSISKNSSQIDFRKIPPQRVFEKSTGEKRLRKSQCHICKKFLLNRQTLSAHLRHQHPGEKSDNVCDICDKVCATPSSLRIHRDVHLDVRNFACTYCTKEFRTKSNMLQHLNTHTGARPYKCNVCDKAFSWISQVRAHMSNHTGIRPNKCTVEGCDMAYTYNTDLRRHLYSKHGIYTKTYECQICAAFFAEKKYLTKHMESHS